MQDCLEVKKISQSIVAPIIILSAPRAGSTLLFETLLRHPDLYTIGGESHALIEHVPALSTAARAYVSNRLGESDASPDIIEVLHTRFTDEARDALGVQLDKDVKTWRLLEKTPKNALRVAFLNKVFKDAKFVCLVRDPRENISSIMQAWRSKRFVTYPNLPDWNGDWSLLLPDGWKALVGKPLASIATFQWKAANQSIIDGLAHIPKDRKMLLNYETLVNEPQASVEAVLSFGGLSLAPAKSMLENGLPLSRYTLTKPMVNKWHANASQMAPYIDSVKDQVQQLNETLVVSHQKKIGYFIDLPKIVAEQRPQSLSAEFGKIARNAPCPCGSGKKYKQCHGQLT